MPNGQWTKLIAIPDRNSNKMLPKINICYNPELITIQVETVGSVVTVCRTKLLKQLLPVPVAVLP